MVEYDPFMPEMREDPFPVYARLREESPVHFLEKYNSWALSRFQDIWEASQDPELYAAPGPGLLMGPDEEFDRLDPEAANSIFGLNPPVHTQLRKRIFRLFSPSGVKKLEAEVREAVKACLAETLPTGKMDVISDLGIRLSSRVACMLIGLPLSDAAYLSSVVRRYFMRLPDVQGMPLDAIAAAEELDVYLLDAVRERRRQGGGGDDVMGVFFGFEPQGHPLSDEQIASHLNIMVVGGTETLPKVFAGGVIQLHRHPDQRAVLAADPSLIDSAFTEIARYEMPTQFLTRHVTRDHELRGQKLRTGQGILFLYRAANRDAAEFPDPDRFDIHRCAPRILSFGHGTHLCLGQHTARLEARIMYEELLRAVPEYDLDESEVIPARSEFVDGYLSVPIHFEPC